MLPAHPAHIRHVWSSVHARTPVASPLPDEYCRRVRMFRRLGSTSLLIVVGGGLLTIARPGTAQEPPPISGVTGTLALEGAVDKTYAGGNAIIVKATDGI